jgi:hypothetical protein
MQANIYVGLSLTSHNVNATCVAEFSDVSTTGNVAGAEWQVQAIGASMPTNDPDRVYVGVQDSDDKVKAVSYADPAATLLPTWQEWNIDLKELSNAGINLKSIKKLYLGVGNRDNPTVGGTGSLYFDDIRLYKPRCVASLLRPAADFSGNCIVDYADIEIMASEWLDTGDTLTADLDANKKVDLKDYAKLADDWLAQLSWPQP